MKYIDLGFTELEIYDGYFVGITKEDVVVGKEEHQKVLDTVKQYLTPPFGFILDEKFRYSVEFNVLQDLRNNPDICCIGIVYHRNSTKIALGFCKNFIKKPSLFADNLEEVTEWVKQQLQAIKKYQ